MMPSLIIMNNQQDILRFRSESVDFVDDGQARNQEYFAAGEVSWTRSTSINVSCTTYNKNQGKILLFFLKNTLKTAF